MTRAEKLLQDMATLKESIEVEWDDLDSQPLNEEMREKIRVHIELCQAELQNLFERLKAISRNSST